MAVSEILKRSYGRQVKDLSTLSQRMSRSCTFIVGPVHIHLATSALLGTIISSYVATSYELIPMASTCSVLGLTTTISVLDEVDHSPPPLLTTPEEAQLREARGKKQIQ